MSADLSALVGTYYAQAQTYFEQHPNAAIAAVIVGILFVVFVAFSRADASSAVAETAAPVLPGVFSNIKDSGKQAAEYTELFYDRDVEARKANAQKMTNHYYDLVTSFYEYGWGDSFHFAPRAVGETFKESISRHEFYLGSQIGLKPGMKVLDVGCGVGGPARNVALFTGASIVGLNNNDYQVQRATFKAQRDKLDHLVSFRKGDFMKMPFADQSFDASFAIEATCHAPDRVGVFSEIFRVLKPGGVFGSYEWVVTDKYDPKNPEHREIKRGIEIGDSLPDLITAPEVIAALREAGFEVEEVRDLAVGHSPVPWYQPFIPSYTLDNFKSTPIGLFLTHTMVTVMETLGLAPKGSMTIHTHLRTAAKTLKDGGETGIFTPMLFVKARKPLNATSTSNASKKAAAGKPSPRGRSNSRTR